MKKNRMRLPEILLFVYALFSFFEVAVSGSEMELPCLPSGDQETIMSHLKAAGDTAVLCPDAVFELSASVQFTADKQQIFTAGLPKDEHRAMLRLASKKVTAAISGVGFSGVQIKNIQVDGALEKLGFVPPERGSALVNIGGSASSQIIDQVKISNPRSWSAVHVLESGNKSKPCSSATISNSEIGPAGKSKEDRWADGISLACTNSLIENNSVINPTDGGIVIFQAPGSIIRNNKITMTNTVVLGGINMVDIKPYGEDFSGTQVINNILSAEGGYFEIGLAIGTKTWDESARGVVRNVHVLNNKLQGNGFGYGIVATTARDIELQGNDLSEIAFAGVKRANAISQSAPSAAIVVDEASTTGTFQPHKNAKVIYGISFSPTMEFSAGKFSLNSGDPLSLAGGIGLQLEPNGVISVVDGKNRVVAEISKASSCGRDICTLHFDADGNLKLQNESGAILWSALDKNHASTANRLRFGWSAPYLEIIDSLGNNIWSMPGL